MIPLIVCRSGTPEAWAVAGLLALVAIAAGVLIARNRGRMTPFGAALIALLLVAVLPVLAINGLWPFDAAWRTDCGATPDANVEVLYTVLAAPLIAAVSCWFTARKGGA